MSSQYKHIQLRRDTQQKLNSENPELKAGEAAFATDSSTLKIGDGNKKWNDLPTFWTTEAHKTSTHTVSIPSINQGSSHTVTLTVPEIDTSDDYSVVATPDSSLPDGVMIWYSNVSATNQVTVKFVNVQSGDVDGGDVSTSTDTSSSSVSSVKLHLLIFNISYSATTTTTTTTTTPLPLFEDAHSFGYNKFGQLGLGDDQKEKVTSPTLIANKKWKDFALGNFHTLAISKSNDLLVAGYNYYGQLGLGSSSVGNNKQDFTTVDKVYFEDGAEYAANISWSGVAAGSQYSLAIDESGHLYSCGDGSYGSLGHSDEEAKNKFSLIGHQYYIHELERNISNSISSSSFDLGSTRAKYVADSGVYRLDNISSSNPVRVITSASTDIVEITGQNTATHNGEVYYHGYVEIDVSGDYGVLSLYSKDGFLDNGQNLIYYKDPNTGWEDVDAGNYHSIGIKHGELYSWGNNSFGQLADNTSNNKSVPSKVVGSKSDWISVAAGSSHTLALDSNGDVYSAGKNSSGQLGLSTKVNKDTMTKIDFDLTSLSDSHFTTLDQGSDISIARHVGQNRYALGYSSDKIYDPLEKFVLGTGSYVISGVPQSHPIAVLNAGHEDCVQYNGETKAGRLRLVDTTADGTYDFYYGDVSINITCAFDMLSIYCLYHGYMGGENILYYDQPTYSFSQIDAGLNHSVARSSLDQLLTFGENQDGQLGTGDRQDRTVPYRLGTRKATKVSAGGNQTFFIDDQNYIWAFGENQHGQLGLGDTESRNLPARINNDIRWNTIHAGGAHTVAAVKSYLPTAPVVDHIHTGLYKYLSASSFAETSQTNYNDIMAGNKQAYIKFNKDYMEGKYLEEGVIDFYVEYSTDNTNWTRSAERCGNLDPDKPYTYNILHEKLDDLVNNTPYYLRIAAVNQIGSGVHATIPTPVKPARATDSLQSDVFFYSNMDEGALGDIYNNHSLNWAATSGFLNADIDSLGKRYPEGVGAESVRLYQYDFLQFDSTDTIEDLTEFTLEFWFNPRGVASNAEILTVASGSTDQFSITYNGSDATVENQALHNGYSFNVRDSSGTTIIQTSTMPTTLYETGLKNSLGQFQDKALNNCENFEHLALVKTSGNTINVYDTFELYYNGTKVGTGTDNSAYDVNSIILASGTGSHDFSIDELRLTSGVRYAAGFDSITKDISISKPYQ